MTLLACAAVSAQVPERAYQYQRMALQEWHTTFGPGAPTGTLAAQIHQESGWRSDAQSRYALGLAQFTADTASDMARLHRSLRPADPGDPRWALRAQAQYMRALVSRYDDSGESWLMALAGYNSGPGWTDRSRRVCASMSCWCDPRRWAGNVEHAVHRRHAAAAVRENRHYVSQIIRTHSPLYAEAGWGAVVDVPLNWSVQR